MGFYGYMAEGPAKGDERKRGVEKIASFMAMISVTQQSIPVCPNTPKKLYASNP